ncbi:hypothetical protein Taro_046400 [Colocasia esculenta]|uniref:Uncharacterized protein n=1 Tax=Colocasia esculenta TaxID=4460 RepID=A0A843X5I6_COLES|nr:hypothetical protein [Colocasia esculenta]
MKDDVRPDPHGPLALSSGSRWESPSRQRLCGDPPGRRVLVATGVAVVFLSCREVFLRAIRRSGVVFDALSTRGHREEWGKCRAMLGLCVLREGDGSRILRRRWFRLSRPGRDRPTPRDKSYCRAIS